MARWNRSLVVLLAGLATAWFAGAAQPPDQGGRQRGPGLGMAGQVLDDPVLLLGLEQVAREIGLTDQQKAKLKEVQDRVRKEVQGVFADLGSMTAAERRKKIPQMRDEAQKRVGQLRTQAEELLTPSQRDRLAQIRVQLLGFRALSDDKVVKVLGITEKQREEIAAVGERIREKSRELFREMAGRTPEERQAKFREVGKDIRQLQEAALKQALEVLSPQQREKFERMRGKPFELDWSQVRGRRSGLGRPE